MTREHEEDKVKDAEMQSTEQQRNAESDLENNAEKTGDAVDLILNPEQQNGTLNQKLEIQGRELKSDNEEKQNLVQNSQNVTLNSESELEQINNENNRIRCDSNPDDPVSESLTINTIDPEPDELETGLKGLSVSGLTPTNENIDGNKQGIKSGQITDELSPELDENKLDGTDLGEERKDESDNTEELGHNQDAGENIEETPEYPEMNEERNEAENKEKDEEEQELEDLLDDDPNREMTQEEKQAMYEAVREGSIEQLDDLLDLPGADINMEWFNENLLMAAIRAEEIEMAEFLLDNGINPRFSAMHFEVRNDEKKEVDCYEVNCRQMAYESELWDLVDLIDHYTGESWAYGRKKERQPRLKKPLEEKIREREEELERQRELEGRSSSRATSSATVTDKTSNPTDSRRSSVTGSQGQESQSEAGKGSENENEATGSNKSGSANDVTSVSHSSLTSSTFSLPARLSDYIDDPNPLDTVRMANPHKYRPTRAFFSRMSTSDLRIQDLETYNGTDDQRTHVLKPSIKYNPGKALNDSSPGARISSRSFEHVSSKRRILCPWNDDDAEQLQKLRKRVKSAPVVLNNPATKHKPSLSRTQTTLSILSEFDLERSTVTQGKGQRFKRRSMPDRYMQAYINNIENNKNVENPTNDPFYSGMSRSHGQDYQGQGQGHCEDQYDTSVHVLPNLIWSQNLYQSSNSLSSSCTSILSKASSVESLHKEDREFKSKSPELRHQPSGVSVTRLGIQARRFSGPKLHSPAGYLDTTEKHQQLKQRKLPTLLINDVYKGQNYSET